MSRCTVRSAGWDTILVSRSRRRPARRFRLGDPAVACTVAPRTLVIDLPDAAALARLAMSGLLRGRTWRLRVRLARSPRDLVGGARPPQVHFDLREASWQRRGAVTTIEFAWSKPRDIGQALADALRAVLRARRWDQVGGPVFGISRDAWVEGTATWPQGQLRGAAAGGAPDEHGRPLGPFVAPPAAGGGGPAAGWPIVTAVVNPHERVLAGPATEYRLAIESGRVLLRTPKGATKLALDPATSPEGALLDSKIKKYAVAAIDGPIPDDAFVAHALRMLATCGVVCATRESDVRSTLDQLNLVTVKDPGDVTDIPGYALSVAAARRAMIHNDAALRQTALAGRNVLPLPTVSVLVSSMRADSVDACLGYLAAQSYPAFEVVLGAHGYEPARATVERWEARLPGPLRVVPLPAEQTLGEVLGALARIADGELVSKMDDDDHYGPHHLTDLVLALHASGADLAAKGARFVHLPDSGCTLDRGWAARETFNVTPAGGTLLLARSTLAQVGGWSTSSRHVDADLLSRIRAYGGVTYRTHGLEYVYVRRMNGHTWTAKLEELMSQSRHVYEGLPAELIHPADPT